MAHRAAQREETKKERDLREGQGGTHRAAPFSRGSPDVTVALFNYSHAYARALADAARERGEPDDARRTHSPPIPTRGFDLRAALCFVRLPSHRARNHIYAQEEHSPANAKLPARVRSRSELI